MQRLYLDRATTSTRDLGVALLAGSCIGGGTAINWQTSLRLPDTIRDEWSARAGLKVFSDERFTRALDAVCERVGAGTDESVVNANNGALRRGAQALGWSWRTLPRDARGCDPVQCGACIFGCRHGGKQGTSITFLADAQRDGNTVIVPNCRAMRVVHNRSRVSGVRAVVRDADSAMGTEFHVEVHAPIVVVAAGGLESPALLLRSGLTNSALGRNLFLHPTSAVAGFYPEPVRAWEGPPQSIICDEHARLAGNFGVRLEAAPAHPGLLSLALPWTGARQHRAWMQRAAHVSTTIVLTRDSDGGRVRVRREGRPAIDYHIARRELSHLKSGIAAAVRAHVAAGAEEVLTLHSRPHVLRTRNASASAVEEFCHRVLTSAADRNWSTLFSAHQMGTCRMGNDPRTSVCDEHGAVRGIQGLFVADASLFPASCGVNPMITVMAVAKVIAEGVVARR